jgi:peptide deformylase
MTQLTVLCHPDKRLHLKAKVVQQVNKHTHKIIQDMFETMYAYRGIGLAATQVDVQQRIVVMDLSDEHNQPMCFINPEILQIKADSIAISEEGCLSVPGIYENVERAQQVTIKALNQEGSPFEMEAEGMLAVCIQHEIDHLDGKLFVDYLSQLKQNRIRIKLEKQKKKQDDVN